MAQLVGAVTATARRWHVDTLPSARFLQVEDEIVEVTARYIADSIISVRRGIEGTTAASHDAGTELTAPVFGAGGGGEQIVLSHTVTLTDAQIKATPGGNSKFELVPAPGAGKAFHVLGGIGILRVSGGAYTNIDISDSSCALKGGTGDVESVSLVNASVSAAFGATTNRVLRFSQPSDSAVSGAMIPPAALTNVENKPIHLELYNNLGAFTGGHVDNSLKITVFYVLVDV